MDSRTLSYPHRMRWRANSTRLLIAGAPSLGIPWRSGDNSLLVKHEGELPPGTPMRLRRALICAGIISVVLASLAVCSHAQGHRSKHISPTALTPPPAPQEPEPA